MDDMSMHSSIIKEKPINCPSLYCSHQLRIIAQIPQFPQILIMSKILRLTLFKIPDPAHLSEAITKYSTLTQDAVKDGKPYIQMAAAHPTHDDPRSQGYTLVARTIFASKQDMEFYDNECKAHGEIKAMLKGMIAGGPPLMVYMDA